MNCWKYWFGISLGISKTEKKKDKVRKILKRGVRSPGILLSRGVDWAKYLTLNLGFLSCGKGMVKMIPSPKVLCQFNTQEKEWKAGFPKSEEHCVLYSSLEGRMIPTSEVKINCTF